MFALGQELAICVRCQIRSELRLLPLHPLRSTNLSRRQPQSTSASDEKAQKHEIDGGEQLEESAQQEKPFHRNHGQKNQDKKPTYRFGVSPTTWKHVNVHQDSVELGVNALGAPAKIRIVRDKPSSNFQKDRPKKRREKVQKEESSSFNEEEFAAALAGANQDTSRAAVNENIENLRRIFFALNHAEGFTKAQCSAVANQLRDGVTYDQLAAYANDNASMPRTSDANNFEKWYSGKLITRSRWFGGTTDFPEAAQKRMDERNWALLRNDLSISTSDSKKRKKLKYKEKLIERVLRDIWGVREREELAEGELDFRIKDPNYMKLLMQHYNEIFKGRAEQFDVRIEVDQPHSIVRISGQYGLTFDAFKLIYRDLKNIKTARIKIQSTPFLQNGQAGDEARPILATEAYQQYLEQLTKTRIVPREVPEGNLFILDHLDVIYLGSHQRAFDDVQRLVAQTLQTKDPTKTQILCDRQKGSATPTEIPIEPGGILPVRERYANWKRWSFSPNLDGETELVKKASFIPDVVYRPVSARRIAFSAREHLVQAWADGPSAETSGYWQSCSQYHLAATIGYLVHRTDRKIGSRLHSAWQRTYKTQQEQSRMVEQTFESIIEEPRELVTGVPGLPMKLENLSSGSSAVQNELRVILRPHKVVSHESAEVGFLPELELLLSLDESDRKVRLKAAQFVRAWRESDVMLPTQATDIRLVSRSLIRAGEEVDPAVLEFIAESDLDIWGSGRLRTPAQVTLAVPRSASLEWPMATASLGSVERGSAGEHVTVEYLFKSLEHQSRMPAMYQGHRLYYSTVEAGKTGGRWDELKFELEDVSREIASGTGPATEQAFLDWFDGVREFNARLSS